MAELDIAEKRVPQDGRFRLGAGQDDRLPRRRSCRASTARSVVIRILDKESIASSSPSCASKSSGFPRPTSRDSASTSPSPYGHGARDRADRQRQDDHAVRGAVRDQVVEDKIITIEDPVEYQLAGSRRFRSTRRRA